MGIRYYAYPVPSELGEIAAHAPRDFVGHDPLMDAWGPEAGRPRMLYLDKCWGYLQRLFAPSERGGHQPAYELVRGDVTHIDEGWIPFVRYLPNEDVSAIARDLADAAASECFVMEGLSAMRPARSMDEFERDLDYVHSYLREAARFTAKVAEEGEGLVYMIG